MCLPPIKATQERIAFQAGLVLMKAELDRIQIRTEGGGVDKDGPCWGVLSIPNLTLD